MTKQEKCIDRVSKVVISDYKECPILPSIRIAQVILESGWLTSELTTKANNCCGIKWNSYKTKDKYLYKKEHWSVFDSIEACIVQQGKYYVSKKHYYGKLIGEKDLKKALKALNDSPYCSDKSYSKKLLELITTYKLTKYDNVGGDIMNKIWLDAGHSSKFPGASGNGLKEDQYVLEITSMLGDALENLGFQVGYSRQDGNPCSNAISNGQDLTNRCNAANQYKADLFISIHNNSSSTGSGNGIETLVYSEKCKEAIEIAQIVQKKLIQTTKLRDRGVKTREDLYVLKHTNMSAILIELGFLSNIENVKKLKTKEIKNAIVQSICDAVCEFYKIPITTLKDDSEYMEAIKILNKHGIITTLSAWAKPNTKYIETVITTVCKKKYNLSDFTQCIKRLEKENIINSPDIWLKKEYTEKHVEHMIVKLAKLF